MKHLPSLAAIVAGATLIAITVVVYIALDPAHRQARLDSARYTAQRQALALERERWELRQAQQRAVAVAPVLTVLSAAWLVLPLLTAGLALVALADSYRLRRRLVHVDGAGRLPVPRYIVEQDPQPGLASLAAYHATEYERTRPRTLVREARQETVTPAPIEPVTEPASALPTAPSFADLLAGGWRPTPERMLLGYASYGPIWAAIDGLLSTAIAGRPGQGKTTALRFVYAQTVLAGGDVVVLDPHGSIVEAIADGPTRMTASSADELATVAAWVNDELDRRRKAYQDGERTFRALLLLADEWPVIQLQSKAAVEMAGRVVLEGRKWGVYALISGQGLPADRFGGSLVRDALSSRFIFKTTPAQARIAGLDKDAAQLVTLLEPGRAVLDGPILPAVVAIPNTTAEDLKALRSAPHNEALRSASGATPERASVASERATAVLPEHQAEILKLPLSTPIVSPSVAISDTERQKIVEAAADGASRREVCRRVFGTEGGQGYTKVKTVLDQVQVAQTA